MPNCRCWCNPETGYLEECDQCRDMRLTMEAAKREGANCDWCAKPFTENECPVPGYENEPTHKACQRIARKAERDNRPFSEERVSVEREPFTDWPNGQGVYD